MAKTDRLTGKLALVLLLMVAAAASACSSLGSSPSPDASTLVSQPKILATLFLSPTPNDQEREATRLAVRSEPPTAQPSRTPAPTAYVGVFVGDAGGADSGVTFLDRSLLDATQALDLPTLAASSCAFPVDPLFGTNWMNNAPAVSDLGCAGESASPYVGTGQIFERGVMYWLPSGEIWVISPSAGIDGRFWYVQQAPVDEGWTVPAPDGLRMPQQGFGAVWKSVDGVRQTMGFARTDEQAASLAIQRFDGGALLRDETAGQTFIVVGRDAGIAYGPY